MPGPPWTKKEIQSLKRQVIRQKRTMANVDIQGRTVNAIRAMAARLNIMETPVSRAKWSSRQRQRLKQLKNEGFTPQDIYEFDLLGEPLRTKWSITKQWGRMNLADPRRSKLMKKKKWWKPGEKTKFRQYLLRHSKKQTPEEIAKIWQLARSTVSRWQNNLGIKASRDQVMKMEYSLQKQQRARRRIRKASREMWKQRRKDRERTLRALAEELRSSSKPPREQLCRDCDISFPKRREFFPIHEKKISIGTSRYFKHRCVLCENKRRRDNDKTKISRGQNAKKRT